jgi:hypothetical protein
MARGSRKPSKKGTGSGGGVDTTDDPLHAACFASIKRARELFGGADELGASSSSKQSKLRCAPQHASPFVTGLPERTHAPRVPRGWGKVAAPRRALTVVRGVSQLQAGPEGQR